MFKKVLGLLAVGGSGYYLYTSSQGSQKPSSQPASKLNQSDSKAVNTAASKSIDQSLKDDAKLSAKMIDRKINDPGEERKKHHEELVAKQTMTTAEAEKKLK